MSLEAIIATLQSKVKAAGLTRKVKLDLGDDGTLLIDGSANPPTVVNSDGAADVTLSLTLADLEEILSGGLNPQMAFMTGRLSVDGDMALAMQLGAALS